MYVYRVVDIICDRYDWWFYTTKPDRGNFDANIGNSIFRRSDQRGILVELHLQSAVSNHQKAIDSEVTEKEQTFVSKNKKNVLDLVETIIITLISYL